MPCSNCTNNGNSLGCPCQDAAKTGCVGPFKNGANVYVDPCTGETKRALPYVEGSDKNFDVVAVKVVPRRKDACGYTKQPCQQRKCCKKERRTVCYQCGEKRADAYPADHRCYSLEYSDAFEEFNIGIKEDNDWNYFSDGSDFFADDGKYTKNKDGLTLMAKKFTKTYTPEDDEDKDNEFFDRFKLFVIHNSDYQVPDCGELYAEACVAARIHGTEKHPFGDAVINHVSDFRLGYAAFTMIDFDSGIHFGHILTNDSIYALYERIPLDNEEEEKESSINSFAYAHWLASRNHKNPLKDFSRLGLAVDKRKGLKWYIDGVLVYTFSRVGYLGDPAEALYILGGEPSAIKLECMHIGFGLFTMLDAVTPMNHKDLDAAGTGLVRLTSFKYQHPWKHNKKVEFVEEACASSKLFGQGATLKVRELKVELRA